MPQSFILLVDMGACPAMQFAVHQGQVMAIVRDSAISHKTVRQEPDEEQVNGKPCVKIVIDEQGIRAEVRTLLIDRQSHLLVREIKESSDKIGGKTTTVIDRKSMKVDEPVAEEQFRWSPPAEWSDPNVPAAPAPAPAPAKQPEQPGTI